MTGIHCSCTCFLSFFSCPKKAHDNKKCHENSKPCLEWQTTTGKSNPEADIACADYFKVNRFWKNNMWKMEILLIFGLWDQEIDLWLTNHEPLIPNLKFRFFSFSLFLPKIIFVTTSHSSGVIVNLTFSVMDEVIWVWATPEFAHQVCIINKHWWTT